VKKKRKKSYYDQLKDPRWIRKRQKILKRDRYRCTVCGSKYNLQVHHTYYVGKTNPPWSYPDISLLTLCNSCHHHYHETHEINVRKQHISPKCPDGGGKYVPPKKPPKVKDKRKNWNPNKLSLAQQQARKGTVVRAWQKHSKDENLSNS
jgi:5-methylcytosine-specific restriction endonuclease McrA